MFELVNVIPAHRKPKNPRTAITITTAPTIHTMLLIGALPSGGTRGGLSVFSEGHGTHNGARPRAKPTVFLTLGAGKNMVT